MANLLGVRSRFGVRVLRDIEADLWALGPFHSLIPPYEHLTAIEDLAICVAPEDASEADFVSARAMGYESRDEVLAEFYKTHPDLMVQE